VPSRETVQPSLRQVLQDSHVAAVTIALLLLWSLDAAFQGLWEPAYRLGVFLVTSIAIWEIPDQSSGGTIADRLMLIIAFHFLYSAMVSLSAAWLLSRWIYGRGPLASLTAYRSRLTERKRA
jgi:hypothetical protein